ncbi:MAG: ABC transporter permease [Sedimenticola sp.]|nr:ABC transporter permease [Sedimenticola sp.]
MYILTLALKSILNRRSTVLLTIVSLALSVMLLLGVERLRADMRESFANTLSGTDLVVGARSGSVQLLLYSVFRIGNPTNNVSWESYQDIRSHKLVAWTVPLSLGDSHRGFRVLGTTPDYFRHYRYGGGEALQIGRGRVFDDLYDAVIGADVARELGYEVGQQIVLAHGAGDVSFVQHDDKPFRVVGILERTGTPVDRTVHVSLSAIEAIHLGWDSGAPVPGRQAGAARIAGQDLEPKSITAVLVGLKSRIAAFRVQRFINEYREEPLLAVLPGVALQELWDTLGIARQALLAISALVVLVGISGMTTTILTGLNERRREMAVLRSVGARPWHIFVLIVGESGVVMLIASVLGVGALYAVQWIAHPLIQSAFGLSLPVHALSAHEWKLLAAALTAGLLVGLVPAYRAYRYSLADGMTIRI